MSTLHLSWHWEARVRKERGKEQGEGGLRDGQRVLIKGRKKMEREGL